MTNGVAAHRTYTHLRLLEIASRTSDAEAKAALEWCAKLHDAADRVVHNEQQILSSARSRTKEHNMTPAEHAKAIEDAAEQYAYAYSIDDFKDRCKAFDVLQDAIWAGVNTTPDLVAELEEAKTVCAQAYQVVGILLSDAGRFDSPEAEKILDNLAEQRLRHADVLPWEAKAAPKYYGGLPDPEFS